MDSALPSEVWIQIVEHATFVDGELEERIYDPLRCPMQKEIQYNILQNLPTRRCLVHVSKFFHAISIRHLYRTLHLRRWDTVRRLIVSLNSPDHYDSQPLNQYILRLDLATSESTDSRRHANLITEIDAFYSLLTHLRLYIVHNDQWSFFSPITPHFALPGVYSPYPKELENSDTYTHLSRRAPSLRILYTPIRNNVATIQPSSCFIASHESLRVYHQESGQEGTSSFECISRGHWKLVPNATFPRVEAMVTTGWEFRDYRVFPNLQAISIGPVIRDQTLKFLAAHSETLSVLDTCSLSNLQSLSPHFQILPHLTVLTVLLDEVSVQGLEAGDFSRCSKLETIVLSLGPHLYEGQLSSRERTIPLKYLNALLNASEKIPSLVRVLFWNQFLVVDVEEMEGCVEGFEQRGIAIESFDGQPIMTYLRSHSAK